MHNLLKYIFTFSISISMSCNNTHSLKHKFQDDKKRFIGLYKINLHKCKFLHYDTVGKGINALTLELGEEYFSFDKYYDFNYEKEGKWFMDGDMITSYAMMEFSNGSKNQLVKEANEDIYINFPVGKNVENSIDLLYLEKMR